MNVLNFLRESSIMLRDKKGVKKRGDKNEMSKLWRT